MNKSHLLGVVRACTFFLFIISDIASAATINVSNVFQFIRTDVYAESGGVIDHGTNTISTPSIRQADASVSTGTGSATSQARVELANTNYLLGASSLAFDVAAILSLNTNTSGDGIIQNPLPDINCCRSFSFLNYFIDFQITNPHTYSIGGNGSPAAWLLVDRNSFTTVASGTSTGILQPGSYRYQVTDSIEVRGATSIASSNSFDTTFNLTAVPIPTAVWLFISGLLGLVGTARHKNA